MVTLFTRDYGIIRAFASGAKSIKSKKGAATSLLTYSSVTILRKKDTYKIYEAVPITVFFGAGSDIVTLTLAQYFCELSNTFALQGEKNDELLRLILNSLFFLTKEKMNPSLIKAITELRTAVISGYMPDLIACTMCGKFEDDIMYFDISNGCLFCKKCRPENVTYEINKTVLSALRHIVYSEFNKLYFFSIPDKDAKILSDITGKFISIQSDYRFATLDFYNSIKE